jgi:ABC-type transporter Mla subunit MlaD
VSSVTEKLEKEIAEIEATQAALRDSIAATKGLAEKAETLLKKHKKTLKQAQSDD